MFFTNTPAELIIFDGEPVYAKIAGTNLSFVKNSESDVFFDSGQNQFYFLTSGRWFRAKSLDGPWSYAGADLPPDFAKIPQDHPRSHVLASVPGSQEAEDAVLLAQVPTTAVVNRAEAEAKVKVTYVGEPEFKPIEKTSLQYATNTQDKVIKYGDVYYLCLQGVWFMSTTATGSLEDGRLDSPGDLHHSTQFSGAQCDLRYRFKSDNHDRGDQLHERLHGHVSDGHGRRFDRRLWDGLLLSTLLLLGTDVSLSHVLGLAGHLRGRCRLQPLHGRVLRGPRCLRSLRSGGRLSLV